MCLDDLFCLFTCREFFQDQLDRNSSPRYHGFAHHDVRIRHNESILRLHFSVTARVISGVASHIQVEETEALHVSRIALMVRGYLRSECVKELLSQAQDSSLTHSTLQLRATMSAIRHPCLIMGQCPSNFEGRNNFSLQCPS